MAVLSVRLYGDPILRQRAEPVNAAAPQLDALLDDMVETMYGQVGIGLAAPQVGIGLRVVVVDEARGAPRAYLNPVIRARGGQAVGEEGCLSLPGIFADVERAEWVVVEAQDRTGAPIRRQASGLLARVFEHEIDHLHGVLFIDRLDTVTRERIKRRIGKEGFPDGAARSAVAL